MSSYRPLFWIGSAKRDLLTFPDEVQQTVGFALHLAQSGEEHPGAKALKGFGGRGVLEIIERHDGNTYRAVYTVRLASGVFVLHCFQKKAKRGLETPAPDMDMIRKRLRDAEQEHLRLSKQREP